jgi:hypothetical protein
MEGKEDGAPKGSKGSNGHIIYRGMFSVTEDKPKPAHAQVMKTRTAKFKLRQAGYGLPEGLGWGIVRIAAFN